jgi:hypothetical protein
MRRLLLDSEGARLNQAIDVACRRIQALVVERLRVGPVLVRDQKLGSRILLPVRVRNRNLVLLHPPNLQVCLRNSTPVVRAHVQRVLRTVVVLSGLTPNNRAVLNLLSSKAITSVSWLLVQALLRALLKLILPVEHELVGVGHLLPVSLVHLHLLALASLRLGLR